MCIRDSQGERTDLTCAQNAHKLKGRKSRDVLAEELGVSKDKVRRDVYKRQVQRRTDEVPLESVSPNPDQPRTNFKQEEIEELATSIQKDGLLQPILVRRCV